MWSQKYFQLSESKRLCSSESKWNCESFQFLSSEKLTADFSYSSACYGLPLFGLEESVPPSPIVSSGNSTVLPQITVPCLLGKPATATPLWVLIQEALKSAGCLNNSWGLQVAPLWPETHSPPPPPPQTPFTSSAVTAQVIVKAGKQNVSCSIEMTDPTWISVCFPQVQLKNKETDLHKPECVMLKNINKTREKAYRVKLSF